MVIVQNTGLTTAANNYRETSGNLYRIVVHEYRWDKITPNMNRPVNIITAVVVKEDTVTVDTILIGLTDTDILGTDRNQAVNTYHMKRYLILNLQHFYYIENDNSEIEFDCTEVDWDKVRYSD